MKRKLKTSTEKDISNALNIQLIGMTLKTESSGITERVLLGRGLREVLRSERARESNGRVALLDLDVEVRLGQHLRRSVRVSLPGSLRHRRFDRVVHVQLDLDSERGRERERVRERKEGGFITFRVLGLLYF